MLSKWTLPIKQKLIKRTPQLLRILTIRQKSIKLAPPKLVVIIQILFL